jgi:hypothetical protein
MPTTHPGILQKSAQIVENKRSEREKEWQERPRGGKLLRTKGKWRVASDEWRDREPRSPHPGGFCMDVKIKELWEKGFVRI